MTEADTSKPANSLLQLGAKLFKVRSKIEVELSDMYKDLGLALSSDTKRKPKVEGILRNAEEKLQKAIDTNNQLKALALNTDNPQKTNEDLEEWLKNAMARHGQNTTTA